MCFIHNDHSLSVLHGTHDLELLVQCVSYKYYDDCAGFVVGYTQIYKQLLTSDLSFAIIIIVGER